MNFRVDRNTDDVTLVRVNNVSCMFWIQHNGIQLNNTISPQPEIDYDSKHRVKVIGVDLI